MIQYMIQLFKDQAPREQTTIARQQIAHARRHHTKAGPSAACPYLHRATHAWYMRGGYVFECGCGRAHSTVAFFRRYTTERQKMSEDVLGGSVLVRPKGAAGSDARTCCTEQHNACRVAVSAQAKDTYRRRRA